MTQKLNLINSTFSADASSLKYLSVHTGRITRTSDNPTADYTVTIPHGYANDNIIVEGWVKMTYSNSSEVYLFQFPYLDVDGMNIMTATWDSTNVYVEAPGNPYMIGSTPVVYTYYDYTVLICIV